MIGQTLAHYEVLSLLGTGGMGEVYRARDTRLDRDVALKLLGEDVSRDPERLARFRREAKLLAALNHPHIAALYGLEEVGDRVFLVMELVEGDDLSERIARGPVAPAEAARIALEIALGLESAHERGIVHRDLKPANVKLTPEGQVKILDFGLARIYSGDDPSTSDLENSPTITAAFTAAGVILGTAAYMSPEQARGRAVDKRTDIWAFGVILWEMLTGERLFAGETVSDTLAAVLTREVDVARVPGGISPEVRYLLERCLERDPKARLRDIGEARLLLEHPERMATPVAPAAEPSRPGPVRYVPWVLLVLVGAVAVGGLLVDGTPESSSPLRRFTIDANIPRLYNTRAIELSPDGSRLAMYTRDGLFVRELARTEPRLLVPASELEYDETGITPFWSPDGQFVAWGAKGRLWKIPADGGEPAVICQLPGDWNGGGWGAGGTIVFATSRGPMYRVSARGGDPELFIPLDEERELDFHQPSWVPDGGGFLYAVHRVQAVDTIELIRDGERTVLLQIDETIDRNVQVVNNPVYSPSGHVLYQRDQGNPGLWALPFDAASGEVRGEPFLVQSGLGHPSVSRDGTLVVMELVQDVAGELVIVSRGGDVLETLTERLIGLSSPEFSDDGRRIAYAAASGQGRDIFVLDRDTRITTRLTLTQQGSESSPTWMPGDERIAFTGTGADGCNAIFAMRVDGRGEPELVVAQADQVSFGPDGADLVYTTRCSKERGIGHTRVGSGEEPAILIEHPSGIDNPEISPDGRFIAYRSWAGGAPVLEIAEFPSMQGRRVVARTESGFRWGVDSRSLYYVMVQPARLEIARFDPGGDLTVRSTETLLDLESLGIREYGDLDVIGEGGEFLLTRSDSANVAVRSFTLVENWYEEFRED